MQHSFSGHIMLYAVLPPKASSGVDSGGHVLCHQTVQQLSEPKPGRAMHNSFAKSLLSIYYTNTGDK